MISCLLLSAGQSQRFGSPKALAVIQQKTILQRLQENILASNIDELIIVLGAHARVIEPYILKHKNVKVVYNKDHNFGQTSSFITGLKKIHPLSRGIMLLPVDYPCVNVDTLNVLLEQFDLQPEKIIIPVFKGKKGHPPVFPIHLKDQFLGLDFSQGINSVWHERQQEVVLFAVEDAGVVTTFNTREEFDAIIHSDLN